MGDPKYLLIGDTHGNLHDVRMAMGYAEQYGVRELMQVGDWGFVWPSNDMIPALGHVLDRSNMVMHFIDGNHDWHAEILRKYNAEEFYDEQLFYHPRGERWTLPSGTTVGTLGGAMSIDRKFRTEGKNWWRSELITDEEVMRFDQKPCDVMVTHDAPYLPPGLPSMELALVPETTALCTANRFQVHQALAKTGAKILYHGHYHYGYENTVDGCRIVGLACPPRPDGMLLVDENFQPWRYIPSDVI